MLEFVGCSDGNLILWISLFCIFITFNISKFNTYMAEYEKSNTTYFLMTLHFMLIIFSIILFFIPSSLKVAVCGVKIN
jgi:FtsH-binding integral membrane protein